MTYQEKYQELRQDFAEKSDRLIKADQKLGATKGFGDATDFNEFVRAKQEWQHAANRYHEFIAYAQKNNVNPDDIFPGSIPN